jgi:heme oxygenase
MQSKDTIEELEIIIDGDSAIFSWNNEMIQEMAEELGETEFVQPRPCG